VVGGKTMGKPWENHDFIGKPVGKPKNGGWSRNGIHGFQGNVKPGWINPVYGCLIGRVPPN
jgi:hypothetical protein